MPALELARTLSLIPTPFSAGEIMRAMIREGSQRQLEGHEDNSRPEVKDPVSVESAEGPIVKGDFILDTAVDLPDVVAGFREASAFTSIENP